MINPMIRNIIFDWSGTLVDDLPAVWQATNYVLEKAGRPPLTLEAFRNEFRLPFQGFYDRFTPHLTMEQLEEWFHACFQKAQETVRELPHARSFLDYCRTRGWRMFLLSTVREDHYRSQAQRIGFHAYLDRPYLGVWDKRAKIGQVLEENNLAPLETLFIGDMEHDMEAARHGGVLACAVLTGYNNRAQLERAAPDLLVEHLEELRQVLERHGGELPLAGAARQTC